MHYRYLLCALGLLLAGCDQSAKAPQTVEKLEVQRYMGTWYELASFPMYFQKGCYCTKATYAWHDGVMQVTNSCLKGDKPGKKKVAHAKAWPVAGSGNAKFKVQFQWPFKGDYWVLYVDKEYQHAIVGTPNHSYLWFLSRKPSTTVGEFLKLQEIAKEKGYSIKKLRLTEQSCVK